MSNRPDSFSFVHLPPEIRYNIYRLLFDLPSKGANYIVYPNALPSICKRTRGCSSYESGLGLLRVCRSVHTEATALVYTRTPFAFSDGPGKFFTPTKHDRVSHCSIHSMYTFLHIIGARNRGFIRYISIRLSNPRYLYYDHEVVPGFAQIANEGNSLGDAFELLSSHHSLRTIVFFLEKSTVYQTGDLPSLLHHLLRPVQDSRLLQQLTKIRGGVKLSIRGLSKTELTVPEELQILCGTLKSLLSSPKESKSVPEELLRVEDGKHDIVQKVLGASKRYSDVVQRIEVAQKRIGEWEALKGQIEAAKEQVKSLTAEKQAIEKGFQDLQERAAVLPVLLD